MKRISDFDRKHPEGMDERYHLFDASAVGRVLYWKQFFSLCRNVPGTIVECGIGRGRSLMILSALNDILWGWGRREIWGFDSFQGFDEPSVQDDSALRPKAEEGGVVAVTLGATCLYAGVVREVLREAQVDLSKVRLVTGYFEDSLLNYTGGPIALLNIDCDLYKPYKNTLEMLYDKVSPGG